MELEDKSQPAKSVKTGRQTVEIPAGKTLRIETSPDGVDILDVAVPTGKKWTVTFNIGIIETNA